MDPAKYSLASEQRIWHMSYNACVNVLVTGVCGQDGSYLAEQLLTAGHEIVGVMAPGETIPPYVGALRESGACELVACNLAAPADFRHLLRLRSPDRVFHLGAVSSPAACESHPSGSRRVNVASVEVLLDWQKRDMPEARLLVASSAAIFGMPRQSPQDETTPVNPLGEYARQKLAVREAAAAARKAGAFVSCVIPFNHESPRRPEQFVFAKICNSAVRIAKGEQKQIELGNLHSRRDWGYAQEYATAMAWMLDIDEPTELVLATGEAHSVQELAQAAFARVGLEAAKCIASNPALSLAEDPPELCGKPDKAWTELGWEAQTRFAALIDLMIGAAQAGVSA
jgi:GDPmannose 4,6-dehydratase